MRRYADKKGGYAVTPDNFDRSDAATLASQIDRWFNWLQERNYSGRTVEARKWSLRTFQKWAQERDLSRPGQITKPILESYWINAGVYYFKPKVFEYLPDVGDIERTAFPELARSRKLRGVKYRGVLWKSIDTHKDLEEAENLLRRKGLGE